MDTKETFSELNRFLRLYHGISDKKPIIIKDTDYFYSEGTRFHMHYATEIAILTSGSLKRFYRNWEQVCEIGDIWFSGIWEPHGYSVLSEPCSAIAFITSPEFLTSMRFPEEKSFNALSPYMVLPEKRPKTDKTVKNKVLSVARRAKKISKGPLNYKNLWTRNLLLELILSVYENWQPDILATNLPESSINMIKEAINLVFSNKKFLPVEEVASCCGMNRTGFSRVFKQIMGIGFAQFALRYRLSSVAKALLTTDLPVKTISFEWGFSDVCHLHRVFKDHYGCSPTFYRNKNSLFPVK